MSNPSEAKPLDPKPATKPAPSKGPVVKPQPNKDEAAPKKPKIDPNSDKRKQSLYFPEAMFVEIKTESARLDRSLSWVVQRAWKMARDEIKKFPSAPSGDA